MREALAAWQKADAAHPAAAPRGALERDVVAIRNAVFLPMGGGVYLGSRWNAFSWSAEAAPFVIVNPELPVKLADGKVIRLTAYDRFPSLDNVLFLSSEQRSMLETVMVRLGGTRTRQPGAIMETPNQPVGPSLSVMAFWRKSFAMRPGHWGGWVFETFPQISQIEFIDAQRTRAAVKVVVGYSGATVQMENRDGVWIATRLTDFWVT